jgi:hypothetical protein
MKKFSFLFIGLFVVILSALTITGIFTLDKFGQWKDNQSLTQALLKGNEVAIKTFEFLEPDIQQDILKKETLVKKALVEFYIKHNENALATISKIYADSVEAEIFNDELVYRILMTNYYHNIDIAIEVDNFYKASSLLSIFMQKYPNSNELLDKAKDIKNRKQTRLSFLTEQYMTCLGQTMAPLLERTHCMADARDQIEKVGIEHTLPLDPNLPAMYAAETEHALAEKNYEQAEKLLVDWQRLLPEVSELRQGLKERLALHLDFENITADLASYNDKKVQKRLGQLTVTPLLRDEILAVPKIQNNLVRYHLNEALTILRATPKDTSNPDARTEIKPRDKIKLDARTEIKLKEILAEGTGTIKNSSNSSSSLSSLSTTTWYENTKQSTSNRSEVSKLLEECQRHYKANRLTTGKQGTALQCYLTVLSKSPNNAKALKGLKTMERRYQTWAETALKRGQFSKVRTYLSSMQKVNPKSAALARLKQRLKVARTKQAKPTNNVKNTKKPQTKKPPVVRTTIQACKGCNCSTLLRQMSLGIKPLTASENNFFQKQCR